MRQFDTDNKGPLDGFRVIDLSRLVAGNMLTLLLADFGAEVIKVESPKRGDPLRAWKENGISAFWKVYARNKKSISLNLRDKEAKNILLQLIRNADGMVESFRTGRLEQMGIGPEILLKHNPDLIIARISGFGQTGPYRHRPGFGTLVEAMSGFASRNGFPDREPLLPPLALADMIAGLYGAMGMLTALRNKEVNGGTGQVIDVSLLEPIFSVLGPEALAHQITGKVKKRAGSGSNTSSPRNVYATSDGKWIAISASTQTMAERLFRVIGKADLLSDPRFRTNADRVKHRDAVDKIVGEWIGNRSQEKCLSIFQSEEVTAAPIYNIGDLRKDPHVIEREIILDLPDSDLGSAPMHNIIPRLSDSPGGFQRPAPRIGEHTGEVLSAIGYDTEALDDLRNRGII